MRIRSSASFPHPILAADTGDYVGRSFHFALSVEENPISGQARLSGEMTIDDPTILGMIERNEAAAGVMVICQDTYLDRFIRCNMGRVALELSDGQVRGTVHVRAAVIATRDNLALNSKWISTEFPSESKLVGVGDLIAYSEELRFEAGLEKLAPLESIFRLMMHDDVPEGVFNLDLDGEAIEILAAPGLHGFLSLLRGQAMKDTLLSSLFLPVVMEVLEAMRSEGAYVDKRWYSVMLARCNHEGIDIKHVDLSEAAQKLLDSPLGALRKVFERASA